MKLAALLVMLSVPALAQLPEEPKPIRDFSLTLALANRYSLTHSQDEIYPSGGIDWRFRPDMRLLVAYSHTYLLNPPANAKGPTQGNNVILQVNYDLWSFGKKR